MNPTARLLVARSVEILRRKDGEMLLGYENEFGSGVREVARSIGMPIRIMDGLVLAVLKIPKRALSAEGQDVAIITWHDGLYYDKNGKAWRDKDLHWT